MKRHHSYDVQRIFLGVLLCIVCRDAAYGCDFAAVIAKEGFTIPALVARADNTKSSDDPQDFYFDFVKTARPGFNRHGYGLACYRIDNATIDRKEQSWFSKVPYRKNQGAMEQAREAIANPKSEAVIVLSHARRAVTGPGNHPFLLDWDGKTYSFMLNGSFGKKAASAIWYDLNHNAGPEPRQWFKAHRSNWAGIPGEPKTWNFSELLFHFIMKRCIENRGDVRAGLHQALTAKVHVPKLEETVDFRGALNGANFALSDGQSLWVYRGTAIKGKNGRDHNVSYKEYDGFYGLKTQESLKDGMTVNRFSLVHLTRGAAPVEYPDFLDTPLSEIVNLQVSQDR